MLAETSPADDDTGRRLSEPVQFPFGEKAGKLALSSIVGASVREDDEAAPADDEEVTWAPTSSLASAAVTLE